MLCCCPVSFCRTLGIPAGATPSGTINSAIRNPVNRCVDRQVHVLHPLCSYVLTLPFLPLARCPIPSGTLKWKQLPCFLSGHVLSGDASDERLSPSIGVKPHHHRCAPPSCRRTLFSDVAGSPSTTFALHASSSLAPISRPGTAAGAALHPFLLPPLLLSPLLPYLLRLPHLRLRHRWCRSVLFINSLRLKRRQSDHQSRKRKRSTSRTRMGVHEKVSVSGPYLPGPGFKIPSSGTGFNNIGFLMDGSPRLKARLTLVRVILNSDGVWAGVGRPRAQVFGLKKDEMVMSVRPLDEMKVTTFFVSATPVPSLVSSASSTPTLARAKPRKTPPVTSVPSASSRPRTSPGHLIRDSHGGMSQRNHPESGRPPPLSTPPGLAHRPRRHFFFTHNISLSSEPVVIKSSKMYAYICCVKSSELRWIFTVCDNN
jgi:hypothetical protein